MARDYSPEQRALLRSGRIELAMFADLFIDGDSLHCSSLYTPISYDVGDGVTRDYEPLADRFSWPDDQPISMGADLSPEPLTLIFDASRVGQDSDFVGRFVDSQYHRRRARLTLVTFATGSGRTIPVAPAMSWEGEIDQPEFPEQEGTPPIMRLNIESGSFRYLGYNVQTRTDANQQKFFPGDTFFQDTPGLIGRQLPWHRSWIGVSGYGSSTTYVDPVYNPIRPREAS